MELKAKLSGAAAAAPVVPVVGTLEIEAIVSAWTGIPVDRLSAADTERLSRLPDALTVHTPCLYPSLPPARIPAWCNVLVPPVT